MKDKKLKSKKKPNNRKNKAKKAKTSKETLKTKMGQEVKEALGYVLEQEKKVSNMNPPMGFEILMKQAANKHNFVLENFGDIYEKYGTVSDEKLKEAATKHDFVTEKISMELEYSKTWYERFFTIFGFKKKL